MKALVISILSWRKIFIREAKGRADGCFGRGRGCKGKGLKSKAWPDSVRLKPVLRYKALRAGVRYSS